MSPLIKYIFLLVAFTLLEGAYLLIARRLQYEAPVLDRSSHVKPTPIGGGVIILIATLSTFLVGEVTASLFWVICGGMVLGLMSLYDDFHPLPPLPRLVVQILVAGLAFKNIYFPEALHIYFLAVLCSVCCMNAFNFIDGIAGMLALYSLTVLGTLLYAVAVYIPYPDCQSFITLGTLLFIAMVAFAIYNIPDKIFAGDVGSITIGFFISYILINLMIYQVDASFVALIIVCLFDVCMTILQRLFAGANILTPHKRHIYQVLTSSWNLPHIPISLSYSILQLVISIVYFMLPPVYHWIYIIFVCIVLTVCYFVIRRSPRSRQTQ